MLSTSKLLLPPGKMQMQKGASVFAMVAKSNKCKGPTWEPRTPKQAKVVLHCGHTDAYGIHVAECHTNLDHPGSL